jgi:hypothetical protein
MGGSDTPTGVRIALREARGAAGAGLLVTGTLLLIVGGWWLTTALFELPTALTDAVSGWWPALLVLGGVWLLSQGRRSLGLVFVLAGAGGLMVNHLPGELFWPVLLIVVGLVVLAGATERARNLLLDGAGFAVFADRRSVVGPAVARELVALFGEVEGYLGDDDPDGPIDCLALFGDVELVVPHDVAVEMHQTAIFGDVRAPEPPRGRTDRVVQVRGTAVFGDVRVRRG